MINPDFPVVKKKIHCLEINNPGLGTNIPGMEVNFPILKKNIPGMEINIPVQEEAGALES
jgi:hypothetical protein